VSKNDGIRKTLLVALSLCIVCSVVVSTAAVLLKPAQDVNRTLDRKRNILAAAGMLEQGVSVEEQFAQVQTRVVDLRTGEFSDAVKVDSYQPLQAAKDPARSQNLSAEQDIAQIGRREHYALVYLVETGDGELDKVILPIRGYGLWSTLHGFIALESDGSTVAGLGFHQHGETPGLGGEVDNPRWKAQWPGKQVYRDGEVEIEVVKGSVDATSPQAKWRVDGLSGATLTSRGVSQLVQFWLGEQGFAPFLSKLKAGEA
jgi:Na+-transporting NADH:ubiquinone oxidoreductase subunit C